MLFDINLFHLFVLITWQFSIFFGSQMIFPIFSNYTPRWRCGSESSFGTDCNVYRNCTNIQFEDASSYCRMHESAVLEYDWICDNRWKASLFEQVQFVGVLLGTQIFGAFSDAYGRKPVAITALTVGILSNFISGLIKDWRWLMVSRFFVGLGIGGTIVGVCTFIMEMLLPKQRMALRAFFNWGVARLLMTFIAWILPEWRASTLANAVTALPALLIVLFILPESPTWLIGKERLDDVEKSEKKIAKIVGKSYVKKQHCIPEKNKRLSDVFRVPEYRKRLFVLWMMWFTAALCGYGTDLISNRIIGNLYINQAIFSILMTVSKIILVIVDSSCPNFNRRRLHQYSQALCCFFFLLLSIMLAAGYRGVPILAISSLGTVFNEYTWDACYLCAVETMPTSMRASSLGSCSFIARVGSLCSPILSYLATTWRPAPYLIVTAVGIVNLIVSCLYLVETKNINLEKVGENQNDANQEEMVTMIDKSPKS
uniref:MFS domain-containing protein n=1 Tax=Syphacia muris TaxID=451379 RepID=A0A158R4N3_9BILA